MVNIKRFRNCSACLEIILFLNCNLSRFFFFCFHLKSVVVGYGKRAHKPARCYYHAHIQDIKDICVLWSVWCDFTTQTGLLFHFDTQYWRKLYHILTTHSFLVLWINEKRKVRFKNTGQELTREILVLLVSNNICELSFKRTFLCPRGFQR